MGSKTFQIVFGQMMTDGPGGVPEPFGGELVFYRSERPIHGGGRAGLYRPAPNSLVEYVRVPVVQSHGHPVSAVVALEATCEREATTTADDAPRAVYSCVHVQHGRESYLFEGYRIPECLSEQTTWGAVSTANTLPHDRHLTVAEAEAIDPVKRLTEAAGV
jgi:hypothetical protein